MNALLYIGNGAALVGVPARDLTNADIAAFDLNVNELLKSGLYKKADHNGDGVSVGDWEKTIKIIYFIV